MLTFQLYEFPLHAYYLPLFCMPLVVGFTLATLQWWKSRKRPLEKASLRWLFITIFGSTTGAFAMYVVPPLYGADPVTTPWLSQMILLIFFIGLALGAARYRLFDVERWWLNTWLWFGMGVAIVLVDVLLISVMQLGFTGSTVLAVLVVAACTGETIELGLGRVDMLLLILTFAVSMITFGGGRTNVLQGAVHLVLFMAWVVLIFD